MINMSRAVNWLKHFSALMAGIFISSAALAYNWSSQSHEWKTIDYNGDGLEDIVLYLKNPLVPIGYDIEFVVPASTNSYVLIRNHLGQYTPVEVSNQELGNLAMQTLDPTRIHQSDYDNDGHLDTSILVGSYHQDALTFYGDGLAELQLDSELASAPYATLISHTPPVPPTVDPEHVVGHFGGSVDVSAMGTLNYTIPIELPPGKNGLQPELALVYNSNSGNGQLGIGWVLSGWQSQISRCPMTLLLDGVYEPVDFDYNDQYCLDGERLIPTGGGEYRTKAYSNIRVVAYEHDLIKGPKYFEVFAPDGTVSTYGSTTPGFSSLQSQTGNRYNWPIIEKKYAYPGFDGKVEYANHTGVGQIYYDDYMVQARYEGRSDSANYGFIGPGVANHPISSRLGKIVISKSGDIISEYQFNYEEVGDIGHSRIKEIVKSVGTGGSNLAPFPPLRFVYEDVSPDLKPIKRTVESAYHQEWERELSGDFNGDGFSDVIAIMGATDEAVYFAGTQDGTLSPSVVNGFTAVYYENIPRVSNPVRRFYNMVAGDFNGDSVTDIARMDEDGVDVFSGNYNKIFQPTSSDQMPTGYGMNAGVFFSGDFNADGKTDLIHIGHQGQFANVWFSNGDGSFNVRPTYSPPSGVVLEHFSQMADFNGDGRTDILIIKQNPIGSVNTLFSDGQGGFTHKVSTPVPDRQFYYDPLHTEGNFGVFASGDFNGDGLMDFIEGGHGRAKTVFYSKGNGEYYARENLLSGSVNKNKLLVGDFNGDAKDDVLDMSSAQGTLYLSRGLTRYASDTPAWHPIDTGIPGAAFAAIKESPFVGDFNRDGMLDLALRHNLFSGNVDTYTTKSRFSRRITHIFSATQTPMTRITYGKPQPHDAGGTVFVNWSGGTPTELTGGAKIIEPAWPVVNRIETSSGLSHWSHVNAVDYQYDRLRVHFNGGGILGYQKITAMDVANQKKTSTVYSHNVQDFQQGMVVSQVTTDISHNGSVELSSMVNVFETKWIGQHYLVTPAETITKAYAKNGVTKLQTRSYTTYQPDSFLVSQTRQCVQLPDAPPGVCLSESVTDFTYHASSSLQGLAPEVARKVETVTANFAALGMDAPPFQTNQESSTEEYTYWKGLIKTKTQAPGTADAITTTYAYTQPGHRQPSTVTVSGPNYPARTVSSEYYSNGTLANTVNPYGHTTVYHYDHPIYRWVPTRVIDTNGLVTTSVLDILGRPSRTNFPDGTFKEVSWEWTNVYFWNGSKKTVTQSNAPAVTSYFDDSGRERYTFSSSLHEGEVKNIFSSVSYNELGQVISQEGANYTHIVDYQPITYFEYDSRGRVTREHTPAALTNVTYVYGSDNITTYLNGQQKNITYFYPNGLEKRVMNGPTSLYAGLPKQGLYKHYDAVGRLVKTVDPKNNEIRIQYDSLGRKVKTVDPDQGTWEYAYYPDGKLKSQTDNKGYSTHMSYDLLGRMTSRIDKDHTGVAKHTNTWQYDAGGQIGLLNSEYSSDGFERHYYYDALKRIKDTVTIIDGNRYEEGVTYNANGQVATVTYPGGFSIRNEYHPQIGVLLKIYNSTTNQVLKEYNSFTASGELAAWKLGGLINASKYHNPSQAGRVTDIKAWIMGPSIFDQGYNWDVEGNLNWRHDRYTGLREDYTYDELSRLTHVMPSGTNIIETRIKYDILGNITSKSDVGHYAYSSHRPHAVTSAGSRTFVYDANGNLRERTDPELGLQYLSYTPFNKLQRINNADNSKVTIFFYGPNRARFKREDVVNGVYTATHYVGAYEKTFKSGQTKERLTIGGDILVINEGSGHQINYQIKDHLGSISAVFTATGAEKNRFSFDPWGKRRAINTGVTQNFYTVDLFALSTNRGYTSHEHIDGFGLIHMNGRVYDPTIARFLSADPIIQAPSHLQSYNRYSYVMNNPLKYVDPSGYSWWSKNVTDKFRSFRRNVSNAWRENYKTIIAVALAAWGGWAAYGSVMNSALAVGPLSKGAYFAASFKAGAAAGAASGAIMGSSLTAMNGGNLRQIIKSGIKGGATGALSGGMFGGAGAYSGNWFNKATLHGLAGGTSSEITGGRFKDGFRLSFGVTALTTAAVYMRDVMVQQSKIDPRNASGESVGFKGDKFKLGGGRFNPARGSLQDQIPSPLGGLQGGQGRLGIPFTDIAFNYAPGSLQDRLVEAYAGPHDWLNSGFWYNPATGNIKSGISTIGSAFGEAMNLANVAVATPFVAASVYPQNLHYLYEAANDDRF